MHVCLRVCDGVCVCVYVCMCVSMIAHLGWARTCAVRNILRVTVRHNKSYRDVAHRCSFSSFHLEMLFCYVTFCSVM